MEELIFLKKEAVVEIRKYSPGSFLEALIKKGQGLFLPYARSPFMLFSN